MRRQGYDIIVVSQNKDKEEVVKWTDGDAAVASLTHMADAGRLLYDRFGFRRSQEGVWGVDSLSFYSSKPPDQLHPSMGQDVTQMGGDIVVDYTGTVSPSSMATSYVCQHVKT